MQEVQKIMHSASVLGCSSPALAAVLAAISPSILAGIVSQSLDSSASSLIAALRSGSWSWVEKALARLPPITPATQHAVVYIDGARSAPLDSNLPVGIKMGTHNLYGRQAWKGHSDKGLAAARGSVW